MKASFIQSRDKTGPELWDPEVLRQKIMTSDGKEEISPIQGQIQLTNDQSFIIICLTFEI